MGVGTADKSRMHHARQGNVVGVGPPPSRGAPRPDARQGAADIAVRPIQRNQPGLGIHGGHVFLRRMFALGVAAARCALRG